MIVKVISKEIITPSIPTPKHLNLHNLSLLDDLNSPVLMPLIFFYSLNPSLNPQINTKFPLSTMLDRLKTSLATTLTKFYPLAGRINDRNYVVCNDEGIPYVQTRVNTHLIDVVNNAEVCDLDNLLPCKPNGPSKLPLAIQVNIFECGGIAIGLCINHKISDAFSVLMFVNNWSIIARCGETNCGSYLLPCFDVAKLFPLTNDVSNKYVFKNKKSVSKRFTFDEISIRSIKSKYMIGNEKVSFGLVLLAFIYTRIVATSQSINVLPYVVSQAVNLRSKINSTAQNNCFYFGNVFLDAIAPPSVANEVKAEMFLEMVEQMRKAMMKIDSNFISKIQNGTQDLAYVTDRLDRAQRRKIAMLAFSNYSGLPVYESDFGWGKPVWVTSATLPMTKIVIFIPSQTATHVDVYVNLINEDMKTLESDHEFISFCTKNLCSKL
ncbi:hypothetical protein RND81_11G092000 [Saponaria officinalis]|uniref:Transferase, Chloramphenicol acetyltransferase-like domain protein n=1 Tax=Saponaria officinalis TaxID=3572 RepID=A0AAW1HJV4_SAPOF